jgi:hypothetical protein
MSNQRLFLEAIADILLCSSWQPQAMVQRINWLFQTQPVWVVPLVDQVFAKFCADFPDITKTQIVEFIVNDPHFSDFWSQRPHQIHIRQYNLQAIPTPPVRFSCEIPQLQNLKQLAVWLGLSFGQLENYAANWRTPSQATQTRFRHYHYHWVKKKHGYRLIEAPKQRMADVQRQIYQGILVHVPLHKACHGFRKKHSCRSYVEPHAGKNIVIHMDLENFFSAIPIRRIHALFTTIGYSETVAKRLAGLCNNQTPINIIKQNPQLSWQQRKQLQAPHLPQGSPSSPVLANLSAYKLDLRLAALAKKLGADYTRYADDLAFSGDSSFARIAQHFLVLVAQIAASEGFSVNHRKTRIMRQGVCQRLTGMTLNCFPNYSRKDYDLLKAILYNCVKFDPQSQNRKQHPNFKAHLQGRIAYVHSLNPGKAKKLYRLYEKIKWEDCNLL